MEQGDLTKTILIKQGWNTPGIVAAISIFYTNGRHCQSFTVLFPSEYIYGHKIFI